MNAFTHSATWDRIQSLDEHWQFCETEMSSLKVSSGWPFLRLSGRKKWVGSGQIITTSAEVTPNGGLVRESPQNPLNSGLGIIVICPGWVMFFFKDPQDIQDLDLQF